MIFEAVAKIDGNHKIARPVGVAKVSNRCLLARRLLMPFLEAEMYKIILYMLRLEGIDVKNHIDVKWCEF